MRISWLVTTDFEIKCTYSNPFQKLEKKYKLLWLLNKTKTYLNVPSDYIFYTFEIFWDRMWSNYREFMSDIWSYWLPAVSGAFSSIFFFQCLLFVEGDTFLHLHDYLFNCREEYVECPLIVDWCSWFFGVKICFLKFCQLSWTIYPYRPLLSFTFFNNFLGLSFVLSTIGIFFAIFIIHVILSLIITISIASLTLVERRALSLVQRRVGPNHVGYRGRLQFIADALKLLLKGITIPDLTNRKLFVFIPAVSLFVCYTFWLNTVWGNNLSIVEIEYNLVYAAVMSACFSICIVLTGMFSRNKYAILAAVRCCCMGLNLEILFGFMILYITAASESFSFSAAVHAQSSYFYIIFALLPVLPVVLITFLLETNRAPFDLTEAESELVAGYTTELGGFFFALFYLGEYFHLFLFSLTMSLCLLGGWH